MQKGGLPPWEETALLHIGFTGLLVRRLSISNLRV